MVHFIFLCIQINTFTFILNFNNLFAQFTFKIIV